MNLTPHPIKLVDEATGRVVIIRQSKTIRPIRINQPITIDTHIPVKELNIPIKLINSAESRAEEELPPILPDTLYIVSRFVADTYKDTRSDFVFPYDYQRGSLGSILGCYSLARFSQT